MTQRKWTTVDGWEVLTGWDRPLQHFFVNIDKECTNIIDHAMGRECNFCHGEGVVYLFNNLTDTQYTDPFGGMTIEQVKQVLELKLTVFPKELMWDLLTDKRNDTGNLIVNYEAIGEAKKEKGQ